MNEVKMNSLSEGDGTSPKKLKTSKETSSISPFHKAASSFQYDESRSFRLLELINQCHSFQKQSSCIPFIVEGRKVGWITTNVRKYLTNFPDIFEERDGAIHFKKDWDTFEKRSEKISYVLEKMRDSNEFPALSGWRNELYPVSDGFSQPALLKMERSATGLFGIRKYGTHLNAYVIDSTSNEVKMWIGKRSPQKPTYPGMLDNLVAGGIPFGCKPQENIIRESEEEANLPHDLASKNIPTGCISYFMHNNRGLHPEIQFIYDLQVPLDFEPKNNDGEVEGFFCWNMEKVMEGLLAGKFKPNCALVVIDFFIRHGILNPDNELLYDSIVAKLHRDLTFF